MTTRNLTTSGNWNNGAIWQGGTPAGTGDDVDFSNSSLTLTETTATGTAASPLAIGHLSWSTSGDILDVAAGAGLTIGGNVLGGSGAIKVEAGGKLFDQHNIQANTSLTISGGEAIIVGSAGNLTGLTGVNFNNTSGGHLLIGNTSTNFTFPLTGLTSGDYLDITNSTGTAIAATSAHLSGTTLTVSAGGTTYTFNDLASSVPVSVGTDSLTGVAAVQFGSANAGTGTGGVQSPVCFAAGTRILTDRGEAKVEDLAIGDLVVLASGEVRPIRWIGRRAYQAVFTRRNAALLPVCLRAGSLGPGVPARDLYVSPKHAMFIDGVLIHAIELVNGRSIVQVTEPMSIEYFHVELDRHAIILAEGAPTESYAPCDNRNIFQNVREYFKRYGQDDAKPWDFCAPLIESGPLADAARARLATQAGLPVEGAQAAQGRLLGFVDHVGCDHVAGWAMDEQTRDVPLQLVILEDGVLVASALADRYRPDLAAARIGFGRHGFRVAIPRSDRGVRHIEVRRADDGALLPGSHTAAERLAA